MPLDDRTNTPRKYVTKKKDTNENTNCNNYCRCCKVSLKIKYGDTWKSVSSVNIFEKSTRQVFEGNILSELLYKDARIACKTSLSLSDRLCNACALKIKKTCVGLTFIRNAINTPHPMFCESDNENEDSDAMIEVRTKRTLPTTVSTPERSPLRKKVPKRDSRGTTRYELYLITGFHSL